LARGLFTNLPLLTPPCVTPDVDLKKAAKLFAQKFATGSSVTKNPQGQDEIVVQGDVTDDIVEMIESQVGVLKGVPEDNVVCIEEKKKKSAE
jgi:density-regulated protein DRP1